MNGTGKGKATIENVELAFTVYCNQGGNVSATLDVLARDHGLNLNRKTLQVWIEEHNFAERLQALDAERLNVKAQALGFDERMLGSLIKRKEAYDAFFGRSPEPDHQATYAYNALIKTILELKARTGEIKSGLFFEFMTELVGWMRDNDPAGVAALETSFEDFMAYARGKYGAK